jgi:hypothetical protein
MMFVSPTLPPKIELKDSNIIKWSGYHNTTEDAQQSLEEKSKTIAEHENKLIISAKKELVNRKCHGLFLYKFTVVTANKINEK